MVKTSIAMCAFAVYGMQAARDHRTAKICLDFPGA